MAIQNGHDDDSTVDIEVEHSEAEVIDEEKYSHKRRLTAIHNAHDRAIDVRDAVEERLIQGVISEHHARRYYRGAVESLIMQLLPVLQSDAIALERDYVNGVEIGTFEIAPPSDLVQFAKSNIDRMAPGSQIPQADSVTLTGLRSILNAPSPYRRQYSVVLMHGSEEYEPVSKAVETEIPRDVLDTALQLVSEALEDAQMGLNIGEGRPHNSLGNGGKWSWEQDQRLPHEILDMLREEEITYGELQAFAQDREGNDDA